MLFSWYIIWYLFLAGAGSGAFLVSACCCMYDALHPTPDSLRAVAVSRYGFYATPVLMAASVLMLVFDLGRPDRVWTIVLSPLQSVLSMGAWLVAILAAVSTVAVLLAVLSRSVSRMLLWTLYVAGSLAAIGVMTYTGLLLSDMTSIDFWHTPWLVVLFAASSVSTGSAVIIALGSVFTACPLALSRGLWHAAGVVCAVEAVALSVFVVSQSGYTEISLESCLMVVAGYLAPVFWCGVVGAGLVVPAFAHAASRRRVKSSAALVSSAGSLVGGLALRYCVIEAALFTPMLPGAVL